MTRLAAKLALLATASLLALTAPGAGAAVDEQLRMLDFEVAGGSGWHSLNRFFLSWRRAPGAPLPAASYYRLYDREGTPLGPPRKREDELDQIDHIEVPAPGVFLVEAWLERSDGTTGPPETAALRFDDVPPAPATPTGPSGWIAGGAAGVVRLGHPASPAPVSGISGYAISVDRGQGSLPCATPTRCMPEDVDLGGGEDDDRLSLGPLPEGVSWVRAVAVSGAGVPSGRVESTQVMVDATPPRVTLDGAPSGWARGPVPLTATAEDPLSGIEPSGPAGPFTALSLDGGVPARREGGSASAVLTGEGIHVVSYYARDAAGNVADGEPGSPPPATALVRIDETLPAVAFASSQDPGDPERIEATVADRLAGPDPARGWIEVRPSRSHAPFRRLPTSVGDGRLVARWDSDSFPPGNYEFRATGFDLAGNQATSTQRGNGIRMVLTNPLKESVQIDAGLASRAKGPRAPRTSVPYGGVARFAGVVTGAGGEPLGGVEIEVTEGFARGAEPSSRRTPVRTDAHGRFSIRLGAGPSRDVAATFAGSKVLSRAASARAHLSVRSSVQLRASSPRARIGGAPVVFSGRVRATATRIPRHGLPVELQFRYPGAPWSEFRTVATDAHGRFRYPYSFSDDDSRGVRFEFRAVLPPVEGWPYEPTASRSVQVTGR